jgi:hypoxanthine phosphoribosyltransferase
LPDFVGFRIGPAFVVGYGLDFDGRFRNLPDLRVLKRSARPKRRAGP